MSTAKATPQDLIDEGFTAEGFGSPPDFDTADTGYLARVIALASAWVSNAVTQASYDGADPASYAYACMKRAEALYASSILWRRRVKFIDGNAAIGINNDQSKVLAQYLAQSDAAYGAAQDEVSDALRALGAGDDAVPGSALSTTTVETGRFPPCSGPYGTMTDPFCVGGVPPC